MVAAAEQDVLLATKLHMPGPQPGFEVRPRLVEALDDRLARGLILVCAPAGFSACGAASDDAMPGGLSWAELTSIASSALHVGGARGWSIGVYNPDLDPGRRAAERIVTFIADVISGPA